MANIIAAGVAVSVLAGAPLDPVSYSVHMQICMDRNRVFTDDYNPLPSAITCAEVARLDSAAETAYLADPANFPADRRAARALRGAFRRMYRGCMANADRDTCLGWSSAAVRYASAVLAPNSGAR